MLKPQANSYGHHVQRHLHHYSGCLPLSGHGVRDENIDILLRLTALSDGGRRCVIAPGDFNISAQAMEESGILSALGMVLVRPGNAEVTCHLGKGSLIDYVLITARFLPLITSVTVDELAPWVPHAGISVKFRTSFRNSVTKKIGRP